MTVFAAAALGLAGAVASVPMTGIAYSVSAEGPIRLPARWWAGAPANRTSVLTSAALTAGATATTDTALPLTPALPAFWLFAVVGVGLATIDSRTRRLPHLLTGTVWTFSVVFFLAATMTSSDATPLLRALLTGVTAAVGMLVIALLFPGQLGLGDVALVGAVTLTLGWLSWEAAIYGLVTGLLLQGVAAIVWRRQAGTLMPMGPALLIGWLATIALVGGV